MARAQPDAARAMLRLHARSVQRALVSVRVARHKSVMDDSTRTEVEAAVFRRLVQHFRERTDVQNIDVMNLAGFCRNCLAKWYRAAAAERGAELADPEAREVIYGMPYADWKAKHQK
jgi:uncharacterized protein